MVSLECGEPRHEFRRFTRETVVLARAASRHGHRTEAGRREFIERESRFGLSGCRSQLGAFTKRLSLAGMLPGEAVFGAAEVSERRGLAIDRPAKFQIGR